MKFTYNWLKEFVDIKISARELADKLTMAGIEVTALEKKNGDFVFEIEITSNRPDWLSVAGIAREVAAITNLKFKVPPAAAASRPEKEAREKPVFQVNIEDKKDCPFYSATIIKGLQVADSPDWLKKRLESVGCRSVNNIVDITNYAMFEWGEPLHAFDLSKLAPGEIIIRRAKTGEKILTIDQQERSLDPRVLVIADKSHPLAIAGVMGGQDSEISPSTRDIILEAAVFNPVLVRKGRQLIGLQSDSSYRFERGIDRQTLGSSRNRAVSLINQIAGGRIVSEKSRGALSAKPGKIKLTALSLESTLGFSLALGKAAAILDKLGFRVSRSKNHLLVTAPLFRRDILSQIDLIEEVARVYGYDKVPSTLPKILPRPQVSTQNDFVRRVKSLLVSLGLNEVITYSLVDRESLLGCGISQEGLVEIENPLSREQELLRPAILPALLKAVAHNLSHQQNYVNIFEISNVFRLVDGSPRETLSLGIAFCGKQAYLSDNGKIEHEVGVLDLKGVLEKMLEFTGIKEDYAFLQIAPGEIKITLKGRELGKIIVPPAETLDKFEIKNRNTVLAEIDLELLFRHAGARIQFKPLACFPKISRDLSIVLKEEVSLENVLREIKSVAGDLLEEAAITDFYRGKQIPAGHKSLTISCVFRSPQRTLSDAEIQPIHARLIQVLGERFGAKIR